MTKTTFNFTQFIDDRIRQHQPGVSVQEKLGQIRFNKAAAREWNLTEHPFATLYFDQDHQTAGIKFHMKEPPEGGVAVRQSKGNVFVSCKKFVAGFNLKGKFPLAQDSKTQILFFTLPAKSPNEDI